MNPSRRHDIDALRVLVFGLLILYHVGMLYVGGEDWGWHLKSSYQSELLQWPMLLSNRWRMALLFLVSGLAVNFLLRQSAGTGRFLWLRTQRLLLPLLFGMFLVVPIQPYCEAMTKGAIDMGFGTFLLRYWSFADWPAEAWGGAENHVTWNHLWYLAYLWVYTTLLVLLLPLLKSAAGQKLRGWFTGLRGGWLLLLPALPKTLYLQTLVGAFPATNDLLHDWYQHALYFTYFLYGWWLGAEPGIWAELGRLRRRSLALVVPCFLVYVVLIQEVLDDDSSGWALFGVRILSGLNTWLWIATVLGWSYTLLNRPFRWLPYAGEAVYPWYILHQSLIVAIAYVLVPMRLGPVLEPLLVIAGTVGGCALLHELIRRVGLLRPLFGLKARMSLRGQAAPAVLAGEG